MEEYEVGVDGVHFEEGDFNDVKDACGICLIAYVIGKFPGTKAIEEVCNAWQVPYEYIVHKSGWILFKFKEEDHKAMVMANGPYASFGRPWILKEMPPFFAFDEECFKRIPTWITLPSLPFVFWNAKALSKIASFVGKPLVSDGYTKDVKRISYARLLVEVDTTKPLVRSIPLHTAHGVINQVVEYEVEPKVCSSCHKLGHEAGKCPPKRNRGLSRGRSQSRLGKNDGSARLTAVKQPITAVNTGQQATGKGKGVMEIPKAQEAAPQPLLSLTNHLPSTILRKSLGIKRKDTEKREREDCDEIGNMTRSGRCFKPSNSGNDRLLSL